MASGKSDFSVRVCRKSVATCVAPTKAGHALLERWLHQASRLASLPQSSHKTRRLLWERRFLQPASGDVHRGTRQDFLVGATQVATNNDRPPERNRILPTPSHPARRDLRRSHKSGACLIGKMAASSVATCVAPTKLPQNTPALVGATLSAASIWRCSPRHPPGLSCGSDASRDNQRQTSRKKSNSSPNTPHHTPPYGVCRTPAARITALISMTPTGCGRAAAAEPKA